ncbi:MAG TPA: MATE family efflux transporter [Candidatus Sulfotelmatobacter sp.]|nr:MATE family efflux transporter [Candidatus Sulfotelmatobacter sp.]
MEGIAAIEHRDAGAALRRLAAPTALAMAGDQLLGIVDTIAIGTLGTGALAAITGAVSVFMAFWIGLFAFGTGLRIVGAQAIGAGNGERFGTIVRSSAVVPIAIALICALGSLAFGRPLMAAMLPAGTPVDAAARYLELRMLCLIPMAAGAMIVVAFATAGDARLAMRLLVVINAVHIPLVLVLALGAATHHPLGLTGAGISSLCAEIIGLAYTLVAAARRPELRILASARIEPALVRLTAALSWPEYVFLVLQLAPDPLTIFWLAPYGAQTVASFRALTLVSDLTWALPGSLGDASEIIVGQRIGAGDYAGVWAFQRAATRIALVLCALVGGVVAAFAWPLAALCTLNAGLASLAAGPLALHVGVTLPLKGYAMTVLAPIRAAGETRFVMVMGIGMVVLAVSGILLGIDVLHWGLWSVPFGWTMGWVLRAVVTSTRLRSGSWERRRIAT